MSEEKDLYEVLGVEPDATEDEIKDAYHARALEAHPDHGGSVDEFKAISRAIAVLGDAEKRQHYDETGCADSMSIDPVREIICNLVNECFLQQQMPDDPIRWMQEQIDCMRETHSSELTAGSFRLKQLRQRLEKFSKSNAESKNKPAVTLITGVMRSAIRDQERSIATSNQQLEHAQAAMVFLNDLKYPSDSFGRGSGVKWQVTRNTWGQW